MEEIHHSLPELDAAGIDHSISLIEHADFQKLTISDFEEYLTTLFKGYKVVAPRYEKGIYLYRGRICEKPQNIAQITYPTPDKIRTYGRVNEIGESFFYAATGRGVPFFELNVKKCDYIALSRWKTTDNLFVNHIGFSEECKEYLKAHRDLEDVYDFISSTRSFSNLNARVHDYLSSKFIKSIIPGKEYYNKLTIAIGRKLFKENIFNGLLYPTIAMFGNADNIVLKKDFVDKNLKFISVEYIEIKEQKDKKYNVQILDSATKVNEIGDFLWSGRGLQWQIKQQGEELVIKAEGGEWIAYDKVGNRIDPQ